MIVHTERGEAGHGEKCGGRTSSLGSGSILANTKTNVSEKQAALHGSLSRIKSLGTSRRNHEVKSDGCALRIEWDMTKKSQ